MNNQESKKQKKMTTCNDNDIVVSNDPISETRNKRREKYVKAVGQLNKIIVHVAVMSFFFLRSFYFVMKLGKHDYCDFMGVDENLT